MAGRSGGSAETTIYAVAERAGVSIATVSRVLSGSPKASPSARERVLAAASALDYVPRSAARSLAGRREAAYGLVLGDSTGPYHPQLALGFQAEAAAAGCGTVLAVVGGASAEDGVRDLLSRVDALAVAPSALDDGAVDRLARAVPVVLLGREPRERCDAVVSDSAPSATALVGHLAGHGWRRPRFVGDPAASWDAAERHRGYLAGCAAAGLAPGEPLRCDQTDTAGERVAEELLAGGLGDADGSAGDGSADALVCVNDEVALGLGARLADAGVVVGRDVAVTGWDDVPAARWVRPALTSVDQPVRTLGVEAARLLSARLAERDDDARDRGDRVLPAVRTLPTRVMIRSSCGCPAARRGP